MNKRIQALLGFAGICAISLVLSSQTASTLSYLDANISGSELLSFHAPIVSSHITPRGIQPSFALNPSITSAGSEPAAKPHGPHNQGQVLGTSVTTDLTSQIQAILNQYLQEGKFKGDKGDPGQNGLSSQAALTGGTTNAPITYYQPNLSTGYTGGSLGGFTTLSAHNFSSDNAAISSLTVNGTPITGDGGSATPAGNIGDVQINQDGTSLGAIASSTASTPLITSMTFAHQQYNDSPRALSVGLDGFAKFLIGSGGAGAAAPQTLYYVACLNISCSSKTTTNVVSDVTGTNIAPDYSSIAIGSDGFARILYTDYGSDTSAPGYRFIRCTNADCSARTNNRVDSMSDSTQGYESAMYLDSANGDRAHIVYTSDDSPRHAYVVYCANAACSSITSDNITPGIGSQAEPAQDIVKGSNGFPQVLYYGRNDLVGTGCTNGDNCGYIATCTDIDCSTGESFLITPDEEFGYYGTLAIRSDGSPDVLYQNSATPNGASFVRCTTTDASTCNAPVVVGTSDTSDNAYPSALSLDTNNIPSFSFTNNPSSGTSQSSAYTLGNQNGGGTRTTLATITGAAVCYPDFAFSGNIPLFLTTSCDNSLPAELWYGQHATVLTLGQQPVDVSTAPSANQSLVFNGQSWGVGGPFLANTGTGVNGAVAISGDGTAVAAFTQGVAVGQNSIARGTGGIAIGGSASTANGADGAIAIGLGAAAQNQGDIVFGLSANSGTIGNGGQVILGKSAGGGSEYVVSIGQYSNSNGAGARGVAIGFDSQSPGDYGVALGNSTNASRLSVAIGDESSTGSGDVRGVAIGFGAIASGQNSVAVGGDSSLASGTRSVALNGRANGVSSIAIDGQSLGAEFGLSIGGNGSARSILLGQQSADNGFSGTAIGIGANLTASGQVVFYSAAGEGPLRDVFFGEPNSPFNDTGVQNGPIVIHGADAPGLTSNTAGFDLKVAAGRGTGTAAGGALVFETSPVGSSGTSTNALSERMRITSDGNLGIGTTTPGHLITLSGGAYSDGASWANASDVNLKTNFATVTPADILQNIVSLPISEWNYKSESATTTHIGPTAQDFYSAFHLGGDSGATSISTIDEPAIALLGIQALNTKITQLQGSLTGNATTSNLTVYSPSNFSGDSVGEAKILAGQTSVRVTFTQVYSQQPIVTFSPEQQAVQGFIEEKDASGFTLALPNPATGDITFDWHSFASPEAKLTVSDGSTSNIVLVLPQQMNQESGIMNQGGGTETVDNATTTPGSGDVLGTSTPETITPTPTATPTPTPTPDLSEQDTSTSSPAQ